MMGFFPRLLPAALCAAAMSFSALPALAQSGELRPDQQSQSGATGDSGKNGPKSDSLSEAAAAISGPAGDAECVWLGRRVVSLLWRDDLDTAFRHLDLYDRFGCPANHVQATFRCVVRHGPFDPKLPESLNSRVHACWIDPGPPPAAETPPIPTSKPARR